MKSINNSAQEVVDVLTEGMSQIGDHRIINNTDGAYMPVHIEVIRKYLGDLFFSIAHYYEQNGDLMRDPEMVFWKGEDGRYYPIYYLQDALGLEQNSAIFEEGTWTEVDRMMQHEHVRFAQYWMCNIKQQQQL